MFIGDDRYFHPMYEFCTERGTPFLPQKIIFVLDQIPLKILSVRSFGKANIKNLKYIIVNVTEPSSKYVTLDCAHTKTPSVTGGRLH